MKRTYKILAAVLSTVMLLTTVFSVPASAATSTLEDMSVKDKVVEYADKYLKDVTPDADYIIGQPLDYEYNQYAVVSGMYSYYFTVLVDVRLGDYLFEAFNAYGPSTLGYLAVNYVTGEVLLLEDAFEQGKIDMDDFYEFYREKEKAFNWEFTMRLTGDCDYDNCLTVKDATEIQKSIVFEYRVNDPKLKGEDVSDFNHDGDTNIMDATDIQKKIVELI